MKTRAQESIAASAALISGPVVCPNSAASRAYYALYQHCVAHLMDQGAEPPLVDGKRYWPHKTFSDVVADELKMGNRASALRWVYARRVAADYYPEGVTLDDAKRTLEKARKLMSEVTEACA